MFIFGKRGQVTAFVIIGIVIVVILSLFFVARKTIFLPTTTENLNLELNEIESNIIDCLNQDSGPNAKEIIERIGLQGGYLEPVDYSFISYKASEVSFLCYNIPDDEACMNRLLTIEEMESQISENVKQSLNGCLDFTSFQRFKPYEISTGTLDVKTKIESRAVIIDINYPVTLKSKDNMVSRNKFTESFNYPLGELYEISQDIIDDEATFGFFDTLSYMQLRKGEFKIYLNKLYPHKLYQVKRDDNSYVFQFAVEGEPA